MEERGQIHTILILTRLITVKGLIQNSTIFFWSLSNLSQQELIFIFISPVVSKVKSFCKKKKKENNGRERPDSYNTHFDLVNRCERINSKLDTFLVFV